MGALTFHVDDALLQLAQQPIQSHVVGHLEGVGLLGVGGNQLQFSVSLSLLECIAHLVRRRPQSVRDPSPSPSFFLPALLTVPSPPTKLHFWQCVPDTPGCPWHPHVCRPLCLQGLVTLPCA